MKKPIKREPTPEELSGGKPNPGKKESAQTRKRIKEDKSWWSSKTKNQKRSFIISCSFFVCILLFIFLWIYAGDLFGKDGAVWAFGYKKDGESTYANGWEYLGEKLANRGQAWLITFSAIAVAFFCTFLCNFLIGLFTWKGKRSKTIGSLIKSLVRYVAIIIAIAVILTAWGVNVASIVASLGVLTLIIGLGCQSLINDVVAGLFIVIDDFYDVGDIVIIDGFRGVVVDIGLKSTKLEDDGSNIKAINNSTITTVTNLTRAPSLITISVRASYNEDIDHVEAIIARELPKVKEKIPALTMGPEYRSIKAFDNAGIEFFFIARCNEEDRFQTTRDLNRELYQMFVKNDILISYDQIVVNPPDPRRQKATKQESEIAEKMDSSYRQVKKDEKKKTIIEKAKESWSKAKEEK